MQPARKLPATNYQTNTLACIAHPPRRKIFERCRLWQQNSPATPDNSAAFSERTIFKQFVLIHLF
jgi:hypothetical protein